jgi:hypothetical protein
MNPFFVTESQGEQEVGDEKKTGLRVATSSALAELTANHDSVPKPVLEVSLT